MATELYRGPQLVVTCASNGAGKGTRLEIMTESSSVRTISDACLIVIAILKWVARERRQSVKVGVDYPVKELS
jgi:hypothetical protein